MTGSPLTKATRRDWIGLGVLALPCMVYAMDMTVLNLAIPAISAQFAPSNAQLLWIIDIYGFFVAGFLITMGTLGDRLGRRKILLAGAAAFALASIGAALATSTTQLIIMRAVLGIAGATLAPSTMSLIRNIFHDPQERQVAIGVWVAAFSAGGAIGPLVGGVLLEYFWWGSVFLVAVPVMILLLLLGPRLLPEYRDSNAGMLDGLSVILSLSAVLSFIYGVKHLAENGFSIVPGTALLIGVLLAVWFGRRQLQLSYPLLDMTLFRQRRFTAALIAYGLSCLAWFGVYIFVTQYLQLALKLSPLMAGLVTLPWALAFIAGSLMAAPLSKRFGAEAILIGGLVVAALGFAILFSSLKLGLPVFILSTVVMSAGMAPAFAVGNEMMITSAPPERAGAASALAETAAEFSGAVGIAVIGSLGMMVYRYSVREHAPSELTGLIDDSALATFGSAIQTAATLPRPLKDTLFEMARSAFTHALEFATLLGGLSVLIACIVSGLLLHRSSRGYAKHADSI
jgi:MFS transporter, DHA2 family, multidrug resistance protein